MKKILIDTEYTNNELLKQELISVALIDLEDGDRAYLEVSDFNVESCSDYVKEKVLPLLRAEKSGLNKQEAMNFLSQWLNKKGPCDIVGENLNDFILLSKNMIMPQNVDGFLFVEQFLGERLNLKATQIQDKLTEFKQIKEEYLKQQGMSKHHALEDAQATYDVVQKMIKNNRKLKY